MAGTRGPVGKKTELLRGHGAAKAREVTKLVTAGPAPTLKWSSPASSWAASVKRLYKALQESAMSAFYQPSDVELCYIACEVLDTGLKAINPRTQSPNATMLQAASQMLVRLGCAEGDRRRLGIEIEKQQPDKDVRIAIMDDYRKIQAQ
jgi:hypothetical protein